MTTVNIHEAKTQFSKLVERASQGETITIARAGRPLAKLTGLDDAPVAEQRLGFLSGQLRVPEDFDALGRDEILQVFGAE